jgi:hypothetical protein
VLRRASAALVSVPVKPGALGVPVPSPAPRARPVRQALSSVPARRARRSGEPID